MPRRRRAASEDQLDLFPQSTECKDAPSEPGALEARFAQLSRLAQRVPEHVRFGTSSWSFPGWGGIVYPPGKSESQLAKDGLALYVRHPLLRTVGIDRSYYAPVSQGDLQRYDAQLPAGFPCCAKVPERFTSPVCLGHGPGQRGEPNPNYLDAPGFLSVVAHPFLTAFRDHLGPMILQFPPVALRHRPSPAQFAERLDGFLALMPPEIPFAVEVRDRALITTEYAAVLARHGASHTYSYWTAMPLPGEQLKLIALGSAPFVVVRLMLRPGTRYEGRKRDFKPFDKLVDPDLEMRGQVAEMVRLTEALGRNIFVLVNNKAEGSAPLTIEALAEACAASTDKDQI